MRSDLHSRLSYTPPTHPPPPPPTPCGRRFHDRHPDTYLKYTWKQCYDKYGNMQKRQHAEAVYDKALDAYAKGKAQATRTGGESTDEEDWMAAAENHPTDSSRHSTVLRRMKAKGVYEKDDSELNSDELLEEYRSRASSKRAERAAASSW
jgi:hypothetical protein